MSPDTATAALLYSETTAVDIRLANERRSNSLMSSTKCKQCVGVKKKKGTVRKSNGIEDKRNDRGVRRLKIRSA